ncbi:MAG: helix-turn-helix transcriptional regulator, partial [Pseudomonadota bacterium]
EIDKKDPKSAINTTKFGVFIKIAHQLFNMRKQTGLSQRALAEKAHTSQSNIIRWETPGCSSYSISKLVEVSNALGYELDIIFRPKSTGTFTLEDLLIYKPKRASELRNYNFKNLGASDDSTHLVSSI